MNLGLVKKLIEKLTEKSRAEFGEEDEELTIGPMIRWTWASKGIALDFWVVGEEIKVVVQVFKSIADSEENGNVLQGLIEEAHRDLGLKTDMEVKK